MPETEDKGKVQYRDEFQKDVGSRLEDLASKLDGQGRNIMYGLAAIAVIAVLAGIFYTWNRRSNNAAQSALGDAIETSQAFVTDAPIPATVTFKTFKTEKARAEAAIKEFQAIVDNYGSPYKEKAQYFIAVNRLDIDRDAGIKELTSLASGTGETAVLAKFALAQAQGSIAKFDEAAKLYQELAGLDETVVAKETINFELAKVYEKQNKTKEAADTYYKIAKSASELKDPDGKAVPFSQTATEAKAKLEELAPERAKEIKEPEILPGS